MVEAARSARRRANAARVDVLGLRLETQRQRRRSERAIEVSSTTLLRARDTLRLAHRTCCFGLDWTEPDESFDAVLLVCD